MTNTDVTLWGFVKAWLFDGGKVGLIDYVLKVVNDFVSQDNVSEKIEKGNALATKAYGYLLIFRGWCPTMWIEEYDATVAAVKNVFDTFADGKVEADEIAKCAEGFKQAYEAWMAD